MTPARATRRPPFHARGPSHGKKNLERSLAREGTTWVEKRRQSFSYNTHGELQTITHGDGAAIHYTYDHAHQIESVRDENHLQPNTRYRYDPAGLSTIVSF